MSASASEGAEAIDGDRYRIVCELGRGGMGVVYLGRDLRRDMDVAIKVCSRTRADAMLWLKREFRVVAPLRHPNLVELFELVAREQSCYFSMEYVVGVDPREWVARDAHRPVDEHSTSTLAPLRARGGDAPGFAVDLGRARAVLAQLAGALAFLHARGVIHRDIKPSNVLVAEDGRVKLLDFGIALERRRVHTEVARERRVVGTAAYLAPEYVEKLAVAPALDVYALGVLAFELATGASPFGRAPYAPGDRRTLALPLASRVNPAVPRDLELVIDQMLAANPERRPTAAQIAATLAGGLPSPAPRARYFIGRATELARLDDAIADRRPGARFVAILGPSGAGKTALVDEALGRARVTNTLPALVWRGRCHERELVPYRAFDFVVDDLAAELARAGGLAGVAIEHAGALGRVFPTLAATLQIAPAAEDLRVERDRALVAMAQVFDHVIGEGRGLVVIDDLQWADLDSLELLAVVVARVTRSLAIVATWADDGGIPAGFAQVLDRVEVERIELPAMAADELAELVSAVAPRAPAELVRAATAAAGGNPYVAELIGRELVETGSIDPKLAEQHRLARLSPAERAVTELAAIATSGVTFDQVRALVELPAAQLVSALRALDDAHVLKVVPSPTGEPIHAFYHQRLHAAARRAIPAPARAALHGKLARLGEQTGAPADQLAHHFEHAGDRARAAHWALAAADAARGQLAWSVAVDWYERVRALGGPDRREVIAECLLFSGRLVEAAAAFAELAARDPARADTWRVRAAEAHLKLGELDRGLAILDGVLARHGDRVRGFPLGERAGMTRAGEHVRRLASSARTAVVAARWLAPWRSRAPRSIDPVVVSAYRVIASFLSTPYPIEAFEYVLRAIAAAEDAGDRDARGLGMAMLAAYVGAGSLGRYGDRAIAVARRYGTGPYPRMVAAGAAGILATLRGEWAAMRRLHGEAHGICARLGLERSWEASFLRTYEALGEYYAGEPASALAILDELAGASDDLISRALLGSYRGRALLLAGDLAGARAQARRLDGLAACSRGLAAIYHQVFAGELALAEHDWRRAEAIGNAVARVARAEWLSALPALSAMIDTLVATAEIGLGDRAAAERAAGRARRLYRRGRRSFYAATALRLRAQAELRLGHAGIARAVLERAAGIADARGGRVDRLAIAALRGAGSSGELAFAVGWNTGGMVYE